MLRQVCQLIPPYLVAKLGRETGAQQKARPFDVWSYVVAMLYSQISHPLGHNDVCDALGLRSSALATIRGARQLRRNTLSHANKVRDHTLAEKLFWAMLAHLGQ